MGTHSTRPGLPRYVFSTSPPNLAPQKGRRGVTEIAGIQNNSKKIALLLPKSGRYYSKNKSFVPQIQFHFFFLIFNYQGVETSKDWNLFSILLREILIIVNNNNKIESRKRNQSI
jgi:hypothetical protein